jgi:diguanylate cyclase (GGDEF)-like protein
MGEESPLRSRESWLVPEHSDRERMLDMDRRLQPVRMAAFAVLAVVLVVSGGKIGYWTLLPLAVAGVLFAIADRVMERVERPEFWIFGAWVGSQLVIALSVILAGGTGFPSFAWFAIPVVTLSTRFSLRGVILGVAVTLGLMLAVAFGAYGDLVAANELELLMPLGMVLSMAILSTAIMRSDVEHRDRSVVDPLTGMLNRSALKTRADELCQQSEITGEPIAMIVIDVDRFKDINDSVGHAAGDRVLQDLAYLIRKELRAYDLAYRLGGEEFVVLLPGSRREEGMQMAERIRAAITAGSVGGVDVTISCGVSASAPGTRFVYADAFADADAAMYLAKREGRNRCRTGSSEPALASA